MRYGDTGKILAIFFTDDSVFQKRFYAVFAALLYFRRARLLFC